MTADDYMMEFARQSSKYIKERLENEAQQEGGIDEEKSTPLWW